MRTPESFGVPPFRPGVGPEWARSLAKLALASFVSSSDLLVEMVELAFFWPSPSYAIIRRETAPVLRLRRAVVVHLILPLSHSKGSFFNS